ncbi:LLM class flavin-dependent oxidoreductase [Gordonia sp. FQ]|uniref:LLM class flavin-dependent oxidoreductase n=1 Tax=Gordonia sp. FQ TaxID=3446634 RepID=UPI003F842D3B
MRVGVVMLPETDPADTGRWQAIEEYGFDHGWLLDHLAWRSRADSVWHATVPVLTAALLRTRTLRIGPLVATPNFRHPVLLAKDLMTLDVLSAGRMTVGLGAGAPGYDAQVLGERPLTPGESFGRFREFVDVLDALLTAPVTDWSGEWFTALGARNIPGPVQRPRPPFAVAANGPRSMRLAVLRGQGWVTMGTADRNAGATDWWAGVAAAGRAFDRVTAETAVPAGFARILNMSHRLGATDSAAAFGDDVQRAADLGFTEVITAWPRPDQPFAGRERLIEEIAADLPRLRAVSPAQAET